MGVSLRGELKCSICFFTQYHLEQFHFHPSNFPKRHAQRLTAKVKIRTKWEQPH